MLKKISTLLLLSHLVGHAVSFEEKIGQMLMVGFHSTTATKNTKICKDIRKYHLGAVILFDVNSGNIRQAKNIVSKAQVKKLTSQLQKCSQDGKLLIAVDQEGGKVQRLKSKYGFHGKFPKASTVIKMKEENIKATYLKMGAELKSVGINYNLAPVVDLDINKKNHVIHGLGRSFGADAYEVKKYASIFMDAMKHHGVLTSLKHFPGHGSSVGDTHKGFVDVTKLWKNKELQPYQLLKNKADSIMVAHVFNKNIDSKYPASLSYATINDLLRKKIGYEGVVITDDLQMGAISKKYGLRETLKLAINAGNDILLIGNQLNVNNAKSTKVLVNIIKDLVAKGKVKRVDIEKAYRRIQKLKSKL
jgi:beta-N-acetylhexosaminidase